MQKKTNTHRKKESVHNMSVMINKLNRDKDDCSNLENKMKMLGMNQFKTVQ